MSERRAAKLRAKLPGRSPAITAPVRREAVTDDPDAWRLIDLTRDDLLWPVGLAVPADTAVESASLVLVGRSSQHEVAIRLALAETTASTTLAESALAGFGAETLDVWIDTVERDGTAARRRVSVARAIDSDRLGAVSVPGARWYATVNANLSVEVTPPIAGAATSGPLEVIEAGVEGEDTNRLVISGPVSADPVLLLVGRRTRTEVELVLSEEPSGWSGSVANEDLAVFGAETVDLYVAESAGEHGRSRRRLTAGGVELTALPGGLRRWQVTAAGGVSVRRQTPVEAIVEAGVFDEEFYRAQVPDLPAGIDPIEHYVTKGAAEDLNPSPMFDTAYYRKMNPTTRRVNPLAHYCELGWKELRNPSPRFNTWWYWSKHLDPAVDDINPVGALSGGRQIRGVVDARPIRYRRGRSGRGSGSRRASRCVGCACSLPTIRDGVVDDYVVDYVRELSAFADVYYLADGPMEESELAKLAGITKGAWGRRHGEYDFGSYARLAEQVGWDLIEQYDELMLVNDSCYLLKPLAEVFARMDARACDWWGLQATKGTYVTRQLPVNQFRDPMPMQAVRTASVDGFEQDYTYDFHIGLVLPGLPQAGDRRSRVPPLPGAPSRKRSGSATSCTSTRSG